MKGLISVKKAIHYSILGVAYTGIFASAALANGPAPSQMTGSDNIRHIEQNTSRGDVATASQNGSFLEATIIQQSTSQPTGGGTSASSGLEARINQTGNRSKASIKQVGLDSFARIHQHGNDHRAVIEQLSGGNDAGIHQEGTNHRAKVTQQNGSANAVGIEQRGINTDTSDPSASDASGAFVTQDGTANRVELLEQDGDKLRAEITQRGDWNSIQRITQEGSESTVTITQAGSGGGPLYNNQVLASSQRGRFLEATVNQNGTSNTASFEQRANGADRVRQGAVVTSITQEGALNTAHAKQTGDHLTNATTTITQKGSSNTAETFQHAAGTITVTQEGNSNKAKATQYAMSAGSTIEITQGSDGSGNIAEAWQDAPSATMKITQSGLNNETYASQSATASGSTVDFTQSGERNKAYIVQGVAGANYTDSMSGTNNRLTHINGGTPGTYPFSIPAAPVAPIR